jgi:hypothetical protein
VLSCWQQARNQRWQAKPQRAQRVEARAGIEPAVEVLQTSALPLGDRADKTKHQAYSKLAQVNPDLRKVQQSVAQTPYFEVIVKQPSQSAGGGAARSTATRACITRLGLVAT